MLSDLTSWFVWTVPLISSLFVLPISRLSNKARDYFVILINLVVATLALTLVPDVLTSSPQGLPLGSFVNWIPSSGISAGVFIDPLSVLFTVLVAFFGLIIAIYSLGYMKGEEGLTRYYFFLLLFIGSMIGLVISDNFLQLFIFWEMVGLCSFSLISFWYKRPESVRSGTKVFLMTRIGDISLLAAIGLVYASLGSFSFRYTMANIGTIPLPTLTAIAFLTLGGAIAKSAQLPLHTWLYSAMEAPTSVSALLHAATMVKAGVYLVARLILILGPLSFSLPLFLPVVAWIGVLTAFMGATLALHTPDIKGVLAYSTISQLGFMMASLGAVSAESSLGWFASLFHMMSHAFFEGLGFLLAGGIIHALGTRDMRLMGGLRKAMPITFGLSLIMVLTTSGLPPFAAFFSKGLIITSLTETGNLWQVVLIYATTMLTFAYSLRFLKLTFMGEESENAKRLHPHEATKLMLYPAVVLAVLCVFWGFLQPWLGRFLQVEAELSLAGSFLSIETPIFLSLLVPTGAVIYFAYFKNSAIMNKFRSNSNPFQKVLGHGYFFDDLYEKIVVKGLVSLSKGVRFVEVVLFSKIPIIVGWSAKVVATGVRFMEIVLFDKIPTVVGWSVIVIAVAVHNHLDVLVDDILNMLARSTMRGASQMKKLPSTSLQHYIAAAMLGFILIIILILLTIGV